MSDLNELVLLVVIGIASIRADVILMKIDEILIQRLPKPKILRTERENPCAFPSCKHDYSSHYFKSRLTHYHNGCFECKVCPGFVTEGVEIEPDEKFTSTPH